MFTSFCVCFSHRCGSTATEDTESFSDYLADFKGQPVARAFANLGGTLVEAERPKDITTHLPHLSNHLYLRK